MTIIINGDVVRTVTCILLSLAGLLIIIREIYEVVKSYRFFKDMEKSHEKFMKLMEERESDEKNNSRED